MFEKDLQYRHVQLLFFVERIGMYK